MTRRPGVTELVGGGASLKHGLVPELSPQPPAHWPSLPGAPGTMAQPVSAITWAATWGADFLTGGGSSLAILGPQLPTQGGAAPHRKAFRRRMHAHPSGQQSPWAFSLLQTKEKRGRPRECPLPLALTALGLALGPQGQAPRPVPGSHWPTSPGARPGKVFTPAKTSSPTLNPTAT